MDQNSVQEKLLVPKINKEIHIYRYGTGNQKILLVHGWSGRGTQLVKIADELLKAGFSTVSFDAPAHGKSPSGQTIMPEFIASILEMEKHYGPFRFAIGHSLGGMSILNAIKQGLKVDKAVIIGSGDIIQDILDEFVAKMQLKPVIAGKMKHYFEEKFGEPMENYAASVAAKQVQVTTLVMHDENDPEINIKAARNIYANLEKGEFYGTEKLGHRKILGDRKVIEKILNFIKTQ